MKYRFVVAVLGLTLSTTSLADDAATRSVREAMVEGAKALLATMERGPGPIESADFGMRVLERHYQSAHR